MIKRTLLAACAVLALSVTADARSKAVMPAETVGVWCPSPTPDGWHARAADCKDLPVVVKPTSFEFQGYTCHPDSVKHTGYVHGGSHWVVKAHCVEAPAGCEDQPKASHRSV